MIKTMPLMADMIIMWYMIGSCHLLGDPGFMPLGWGDWSRRENLQRRGILLVYVDEGCKYILAYHQWIAYLKWLSFCPEEAEHYHLFEVCAYEF